MPHVSGFTGINYGIDIEPEESAMPESVMPAVGDSAPPIDAPITGGATFSLQAHRGQWMVVYFYPRANTPG